MKSLLVLALTLAGHFAFSAEATHEHREHGAHVHGVASLAIAFDKTQGQIELNSPADSIIGFEHAAKTTADKKKVSDTLALIENKISEMVAFDPKLNCKFKKDKLEVAADKDHDDDDHDADHDEHHHHHGEHSDVAAVFTVNCDKTPAREQITINVQKTFPRIKKLNLTFLAGDQQKSEMLETK